MLTSRRGRCSTLLCGFLVGPQLRVRQIVPRYFFLFKLKPGTGLMEIIMKYFLLFFFGASNLLYCQQLHHQMLSSQGTSKVLSNGTYISQTVGQQSVIGTYAHDGVTYGQGFQQRLWNKYISSNAQNAVTTVVYPNPFVSTINVQFSEPIKEPIAIRVFDIRGRLVFTDTRTATNTILTLELPNLASSTYLIQLATPTYTYYSQILKQQ